MQIPVEITFHNMPNSKRIEAEIRKRVAKLKRYFGRLISCRVSVEARSNHHRTGNIYEVHVEMGVPRAFLVVSREPHHVRERRTHFDVRASVHEAFEAAEAQLRSFNKKRHDHGRVVKEVA
jgi:ribosomal subunit interface protein